MVKSGPYSFSLQDYPIDDINEIKIGIVCTEWNTEVIQRMKAAARDCLLSYGVKEENIEVYYVPGSFELPLGAKMLLASKAIPDAIICLGCVIKGETKHDEYINMAVSTALAQLNVISGIPVLFGVLTTQDKKQAMARAGGDHGNKGEECAMSALKMISLKEGLSSYGKKISF